MVERSIRLTTVQHRGQNHQTRANTSSSIRISRAMARIFPSDWWMEKITGKEKDRKTSRECHKSHHSRFVSAVEHRSTINILSFVFIVPQKLEWKYMPGHCIYWNIMDFIMWKNIQMYVRLPTSRCVVVWALVIALLPVVAPPHFSPSPIACNETSVLSSTQHRKLLNLPCTWIIKPQSSAFNHVCLVIID